MQCSKEVASRILQLAPSATVDEACKALGLTPDELCDAVSSCREIGYSMSVVGETVVVDPKVITPNIIKYLEKGRMHVGSIVKYYDIVDSTQSVAKKMLRELPSGAVIIAGEQLRGRGRRGRSWYSPRGGVWMSIVFEVPPEYTPLLGLAAAKAVYQVMSDFGCSNLCIKWPNDIYIRGKKVAGILTESVVMGYTAKAVVGVGINVNNEIPKEVSDIATSLRLELGEYVPLVHFIEKLLDAVEASYNEVLVDKKSIVSFVEERLCILNKKVKVHIDKKVIEGVVTGLCDDGSLRILVDGKEVIVGYGEVEKVREG